MPLSVTSCMPSSVTASAPAASAADSRRPAAADSSHWAMMPRRTHSSWMARSVSSASWSPPAASFSWAPTSSASSLPTGSWPRRPTPRPLGQPPPRAGQVVEAQQRHQRRRPHHLVAVPGRDVGGAGQPAPGLVVAPPAQCRVAQVEPTAGAFVRELRRRLVLGELPGERPARLLAEPSSTLARLTSRIIRWWGASGQPSASRQPRSSQRRWVSTGHGPAHGQPSMIIAQASANVPAPRSGIASSHSAAAAV